LNDQSRSAGPHDPRVDAALREYLERLDRGEPVDRDEFLARHSPIADQLRSFIAAEDEVRNLAGAKTPLDPAHDSTKSFVRHGEETIAPQSVARREAGSGELTGQFGRYRIVRVLGKGAMGAVYLAEDTQLERSVAIKTPHFTESLTEESLERFYREARVAATLRQPNICPVHDVGQIDGKHYISMAYIEGRPLSAFIQHDKPQTERQILIVVRKLALALQEAHDHGIVHRDLKPANIMVDKKGEPIIMDFGLARQTRREGDIRLTQTGNILGTPAYMSPEQVEGEPDNIGPATDQYSLGVILYELLTAQLPFRGSVAAVMGQILTKEPLPPSQSRSALDPRIEAVCLKMMAKNPSERFASAKAVADELATILKTPAAKAPAQDKPASSPAPPSAGDRLRADVGASQVLKSLKPKTVTESDLASLEELARKCYSRRDFEQVIQIIERIPEEKRNAGLVALLENARGKADEISFLICDIDDAERLNDAQTALKKAEALLAIKPGHHRAFEVQEKYSGYGDGGAARIGVLDQFRRPLNDRGWIPWSVLAFGLAVFGVMTAVIVIYLRGTAIVIDIQDPGVAVSVNGSDVVITGPKNEKVTVTPGDQELTITYAGLKLLTKSFTLQKGDKPTVTVSIVNKEIVARLQNEILPLTPAQEEKTSSPTASGKGALLPQTPAHVGKEVVKTQPGEKKPADAVLSPPAVGPKPNIAVTPTKFFRPFLIRGEWTIDNDELVQPTLATGDQGPLVVFGEETLSNYDLTLEVKKTGGRDSLGIFFHWLGPGHHREFSLVWGNGGTQLAYRYNGKWGPDGQSKRLNYSSNRWYSLKVETRGDTFRAYLDGVLLFEQTDARFTHGRICLFTNNAAARFRRIKVSDPQGNMLFEGLPELPPTSEKTTAKTNIGNGSRLLTAGETAAKSAQEQWAERMKTPVISTNSLGMKLALIPAGEFQMGSPNSEKQRRGNEQQHRVRITQPFYLGVYEVTQSEFEQVMGRNPSSGSNGGGPTEAATGVDTRRNPVEQVSWYDAVEFCNKLSEKEGRRPYYRIAGIRRHADGWIREAKVSVAGGGGYRLPTEAQWECACRAGMTTPFNFGTASNGAESNCDGKAPYGTEEQGPALGRTIPVGGYRPNAFGLYDMHGNVWEWCWDVYDEAYYKHSPEADPAGPSGGSSRVLRGGGFPTWAVDARAALRDRHSPGDRYYYLGFRVACDATGGMQFNPSNAASAPSADGVSNSPAVLPNVATTAPKTFGRPFLVRGQWRIENDELVQPTLAAGEESYPLLAFGEESLSNYDLTLDAEKTGGAFILGIHFHWQGPGHHREFRLVGNGKIDFSFVYKGKWGREAGNSKRLSFSSNRWCSLKVEVRGETFRAYLDGALQFEQTDARFKHGRICLFTWNAAARFRRIKVSDPQGKVLFEGLPELPPASDKATPKTNNGHRSRLLTAGETAAKSAQEKYAKRLKTPVSSTNSLGIKLALIPPGEFPMGSPKSERERHRNEQQRRVRITKPFYLGVYEITQSEFEQVMGRNPSEFSNSGGQTEAATGVDTSRCPVETVTWYDAVEFCNKLSEKEGRPPYYGITGIKREGDGWIKEAKVSVEGGGGYRLPTEAQWEYACRAGSTTPFNFGTANNGAESNCNGTAPYGTAEQGPALGRPVPVGGYGPNAFGLYDMHGNVWEWCWDVYDEGYYKNSPESDPAGPSRTPNVVRKKSKTKNSPASDPAGPSGASDRVMRGGAWCALALECRAAHRGWNLPGHRHNDRGFRVARGSEE
jgi:formylglycine-generating enzyme required for sulfatase activity/serine/threonine protein kinase